MPRPQDVFTLLNYAVKESAYGGGTAIGTIWHKMNGPGVVLLNKTEDTDQDEVTGTPYVSEGGGVVTEDRTAGSVEFKGGLDLLTFFYAALFANVSVTGTNPNAS